MDTRTGALATLQASVRIFGRTYRGCPVLAITDRCATVIVRTRKGKVLKRTLPLGDPPGLPRSHVLSMTHGAGVRATFPSPGTVVLASTRLDPVKLSAPIPDGIARYVRRHVEAMNGHPSYLCPTY